MLRRTFVIALFFASAASAQQIAEYKLPMPDAHPMYIATGADGTIWFTEIDGNNVGKITPDGKLTEYPLPIRSAKPQGIVVAADGSAWFAESNATRIGRITPAGSLTEFHTAADPFRVCASPTGAIYFTEYEFSGIGRIGTDGAFAHFLLPPSRGPWACAADSDGNVWFTEWNGLGPTVGRLSPSGLVTQFAMPADAVGPPDAIVLTPDRDVALIGTRMNANGVFTAFPTGAVPNDVTIMPGDLTVGNDGSLWFTKKYYADDGSLSGSIVRIDPKDQITEYNVNGLPSGIAADQHGGIWVTVYPDRIIHLMPYARRRAAK